MSENQPRVGHGPFQAHQIKDGDRYELSAGHPIYCAPAGRDHAGSNLTGAAVIETDPDVEWAGVDAGFSAEPGNLRAPDIAVAPPGDERGWISGVPPLAVEYAGVGQDEDDLQTKIAELLDHGTRLIWVVRLVGPRRVEVYAEGQAVRVLGADDNLEAPGILKNPVPVRALYDREVAHEAVLRNLLQRHGYDDLASVRAEGLSKGREQGREEGFEEGREDGLVEGIVTLLQGRGLEVDDDTRRRLEVCRDPGRLKTYLLAAVRIESLDQLFD